MRPATIPFRPRPTHDAAEAAKYDAKIQRAEILFADKLGLIGLEEQIEAFEASARLHRGEEKDI